ncbi:poly(A)-specific ribonuclease PARN-like isoform X1 [Coffea arabica]|uniref:Poly(A)-specific ribonuclease PARN-like isoform X1 n=1 Tax=Coffea arabica TaxID=13443 RepID=A0A6P6TX62_COFAR|nr:poly(A)-specific ribonuclease PARN-like isoform X1 [Coffea arabica]
MLLQRRLLCTQVPKRSIHPTHHQNSNLNNKKWAIKQVTKSNFAETLEEIKTHIFNSDFIAVSLQKTGAFSSPWQKVLPFDTAEVAYLKAKYAAERFQVLQFAVCPFSVKSSKIIAHPYNFHLFPRDELKMGMPSYSFFCQSSYLTAMAQEGFDFNACIYDGISYLSRAQELAAKDRTGNPLPRSYMKPSQSPTVYSVADSMFVDRIKSRIKIWKRTCQDSEKKTEDDLISTLRKIVSGGEVFGSRPSLSIDICSERQVQLILETLQEFTDLVPLLVPAKVGGSQAIRVVLTSSKEDRNVFEKELQLMEEEHNMQVRGFREVVDLISTSQKPVVAHNAINEFAFIHSKFIAPLPSTVDEFRSSLCSVFSHIVDVNHLMREIGPLNKVNNLPAAILYLKRRFTRPLHMEIPQHIDGDEVRVHGRDVLRISELFAKLCLILRIVPESPEADYSTSSSTLECYANVFNPCFISSSDLLDDDVNISTEKTRRISVANLVFLWGFRGMMSARKLKSLLKGSHEVFSGEIDVRLADRNCAIVVFWAPGFAERFLKVMNSGGTNCEPIKDMISEGLRAACYRTYKRVCELSIWEPSLADALEKALEEASDLPEANSEEELPAICWDNDELTNLDDL